MVMTYMEFKHVYGDLDLVAAASGGNAAEVRRRLERGSPANSYHLEGSSALWWAVASGSPETVQLLLEHGADPNSRGQFNSVIDQAVESLEIEESRPRKAIVQALLDRASQIKDPAQVKLLKEALAGRKPDVRGQAARTRQGH